MDQQQRSAAAAGYSMQANAIGIDVRLANVFAKPGGKFGAPRTDPGPLGTRVVDESGAVAR
jgi:hypothetical protein